MSFIREIDRDEANPKLDQLYDLMSTEDGEVFNVAKIWGLFPSIMESWVQFYESIMEEDHALSRAQKEMIAVRVSELNECEY